MHTVSLRTEATLVNAQAPRDLGQTFKVDTLIYVSVELLIMFHCFFVTLVAIMF